MLCPCRRKTKLNSELQEFRMSMDQAAENGQQWAGSRQDPWEDVEIGEGVLGKVSSTHGLTLIFLIPLILEFKIWDRVTNSSWIYMLGDMYSMSMNLGKVRFEVSEYLKIRRVPCWHGPRKWFRRKSKDASQIVTFQTVSEKTRGRADTTRGWEREAVASKETQLSVTEVSVKFKR